jgi:Flp pilus assembly protein TadD
LPILKKATALPKVHPKAYYLTGVAYARTGQPVAAAECLEKAVASEPGWAEPRVELAVVYDQLGRTQEAAAQRKLLERPASSALDQRTP